jgi:uncharacterized delta-60 repeat protein
VAALASDGSLVLTGFTGQTWVVARLTPAGTLDPSFGEGGIASVGGRASGRAVSLFADGGVAALGYDGPEFLLTRLTPSGAADPAFHDGTPLPVLGSFYPPGLLARADGAIDVLVSGPAKAELRRYTPTGERDGSFGKGGAVSAPGGAKPGTLLAAPDGTELLTAVKQPQPGFGSAAVTVTRVGGDGAVLRRAEVALLFGGGFASAFSTEGPPVATVTSLEQTGYTRAARWCARTARS